MISNYTKELRQQRKQFKDFYGETTTNIVKNIYKGKSSTEVADLVGVSVKTVAATKANLTRGTYCPFAYPDNNDVLIGTCKF